MHTDAAPAIVNAAVEDDCLRVAFLLPAAGVAPEWSVMPDNKA
jgi:hypothetical protein